MLILGLLGRAGAGKDTIAGYLYQAHGFEVPIAFADPLYAALSAMLGIPAEELADRDRKEQPIDWLGRSPRMLLQSLGTEWGRYMVHTDLWVMLMDRRVSEAQRAGATKLVITDVRFDNEARWILERGGLLWEVYGRGDSNVRPHVSESGVPPTFARRSIYNGGDWCDTAAQIDQALATDLEMTQ
jgi:hypothetical protein